MPKTNGRPRKAADETRDQWGPPWRCTKEQRAVLEGKAAASGLALSAYCRNACLGYPIRIQFSKQSPELISLMRRANANLHQVMKDVRFMNFYPGIEDDLKNVIQEMAEAFRRVHGHDP